MKKNDINELITSLDNENSIYEVLISRINILNRVIVEQQKMLEEFPEYTNMGNDNKEKVAELEEEIKKLNIDLEMAIEMKEKAEKNTEKHKNLFQQEKNKLKKMEEKMSKLESFAKASEIYCDYMSLDNRTRNLFENIILDDSAELFVASASNSKKLKRVYNVINDYIMRNKSEFERNAIENEDIMILSRTFDFFYEIAQRVDSTINFKRLCIEVGSEYDDEKCTRIGAPYGVVKKVLLQGYTIDDDIVMSIVLVED